MVSMMIWVVALAVSIAGVCLTVALDWHSAHVSATAFVTLGIVAAAVNEHRAAELAGGSQYSLAAIAARYMGLMWAWSTLSAYVVYAFIIDWPHWVAAVMAMLVSCVLCLFMAMILDREAAAEIPDGRAPMLVRVLIKSQFVLGAILSAALIAYQRRTDLALEGAQQWVALNLATCTAVGLITLTGYLIIQEFRQSREADLAAL
jgi:hypothetical protein